MVPNQLKRNALGKNSDQGLLRCVVLLNDVILQNNLISRNEADLDHVEGGCTSRIKAFRSIVAFRDAKNWFPNSTIVSLPK